MFLYIKMNYNKIFLFTWLIVFTGCSSNNSESQNPENNEWITIFNGKDLEGWTPKIHRHETGENYAETFRVNDGLLEVNYDDYDKFEERYGHLFYHKPYSSFHLKWEYKFTDQWLEDAPSYTYRNSGVMFHSQDPHTILKDQDWPVSVEFQLLAEEKVGVKRPTGNICSPGTEVVYQGKVDPRHCIDSNSKTYKWDQWVKAELIVYGDSLVTHIINGDTVLQYNKPRIGSTGVVNNYDPKIIQFGKPLKEGFISFQAEGQGIQFRDIKIKDLEQIN